jgi:hypothetical protein
MKEQKGIALLMTLFWITLLFTMVAALLPMMTNEVRASAYNADYVIAQYTADAVAKFAIKQVQANLNNGIVPTTKTTWNERKISDASSVTVKCTIEPSNEATELAMLQNLTIFPNLAALRNHLAILTPTPTPTPSPTTTQDPTVIKIRATATCRATTASAAVNVYLEDSPVTVAGGGVLDLMNTASYSHSDHNPCSNSSKELRWTISTANGTRFSSPSSGATQVMQVMFNDAATSDTIKIAYRASAAITGSTDVGGGYGIYYGMIGNADDMNAYVLQFDPGATEDTKSEYFANKGSLLVKKVIFSADSSDFESIVTSSPGNYEANEYGVDSGNTSDYWALPFQTANSDETMRVPLDSDNDSSVNGTSLETLMNNYYGSSTFDIYAAHTFTIEAKLESDNNMWHYIYCDDNPTPILKFYDHSEDKRDESGPGAPGNSNNDNDGPDVTSYKLTSFKGTHTGLRVWNNSVSVNFVNESDSSSSQTVFKSIVWIK